MKYEAPKLTSFGTVAELTKGGVLQNSDVPAGSATSTAYPSPPGS